ncbi:AI-2E family transporter [Leuconostocaceae bacterium ESL0723]|nr:AI-2E family transporter [Leuconostocaceae bacterium ESL0723]
MFPNPKAKKLFFWTIELLALTLLVFIVSRLDFLMHPLSVFMQTVLTPLLISGFLYYVLKPILKLVEKIKIGKRRIPHIVAVTITFLIFLLVVFGAMWMLLPTIVTEVTNLITTLPSSINDARHLTNEIIQSHWFRRLHITVSDNDIKNSVSQYASTFLSFTAGTLQTVVATATSVTINILTIPIVLFYMLSDGERLVPAIQKFFPNRRNAQIADLAGQMDRTIEKYISGQAIQMVFVGFSMSIGYLIIGEPYAWLLGLIAGITNIVPYVGPWIGVIPALIVGGTISWKMVVLILIVMAIVQQVVGSVIYPKMIGKSLKIHPLTIMLLLLAAGNLWGMVGMILIVPVYAVARTVVVFVFALRRIDQNENKNT